MAPMEINEKPVSSQQSQPDKIKGYEASFLDRALVSTGNTERLEELFRKARAGKSVTLAFLGGSITQGCNASVPERRYVDRVTQWFRDTFPKADITLINAGVGATTSLVGVHRAQKQVLSRNPDLVIVDFAVNDNPAPDFRESYESLIRDLLSAPSSPAILELFMIIEGGINEQAVQTEIGLHYGVPMISYRNLIQELLDKGSVAWNDVSTDEVHPNDTGHGLAAGLITDFFKRILAAGISGKTIPAAKNFAEHPANGGALSPTGDAARGKHSISAKPPRDPSAKHPCDPSAKPPLPAPLYSSRFCGGAILDSTALAPFAKEGFRPYPEGFQVFQNGWKLDPLVGDGTPKGSLTIDITASNIGILYMKTVDDKSGSLTVRVSRNGRDEAQPIRLDTRFMNGWGDYAETAEIVRDGERRKSRLEITAEGPVTILAFLVS